MDMSDAPARKLFRYINHMKESYANNDIQFPLQYN